MYEIQTSTLTPENYVAGPFPVAIDTGNLQEGAEISKLAPIVEESTGLREIKAADLPTTGENASAGSLDKIVGIAADDSSGGKVVYYLTGEFFGNALTLPEGVTVKDIKPTLRKLGIFLKEMN